MKENLTRLVWCGVGLFLVIMGVYFIIRPDATLVSIAFLLGLAMLVSGLANIIVYLTGRRNYLASGWFLADGAVDLIAGVVFLCNKWLAAAALPYLFALWAIVSGAVKCVSASVYRRLDTHFWGWPLTIGLLLLIFGVCTFVQPMIATVAIAVFVAVTLISQGLMAFMRGAFAPTQR